MPCNSFLHLPPLPQALLIDFLSLTDALKLSTCSLKTKAIVRSSGVKCYSLRWGDKDEYRQSISLRGHNYWDLVYFQVAPKFILSEEHMWIQMNGVKLCVCDAPHGSYWYFEHRDDRLVDRVSEHLVDVLRPRAFDLHLPINFPMTFFAWKYTRKLENLRLKRFDKPVILRPEDVKTVLEDVHVENLELDIKVTEEGFLYSKGLKNRSIVIVNPSWLHFDAILNSNLKSLNFHGCLPDSFSLNTFLKHWISGGMDHLEIINFNPVIYRTYPQPAIEIPPPSYKQDVFEGIQFTDWDLNINSKTIRINGREYWLGEGREIVRCDGKKRAILMGNFEKDKAFSMFIFTSEQVIREEKKKKPVDDYIDYSLFGQLPLE